MSNPKRLIEVDLPIKEISRHARREKSIRQGHISTLHIWWARRPLAACRAVVLAALLPDPADESCPAEFRKKAVEALRFRYGGRRLDDPEKLREALLDFIGEFADWDRSTDPDYLACSRSLVAAAHPDGRPLVVDPFAGGGAIPLESLRVGADAWASDYNPVAALLLRVVLEDIPRYGARLANATREWGARIKERVEADLDRFYPADSDGAVPIAYLWARTVTCEGPGCGAEVPLLRQLWLARKKKRSVALGIVIDRAEKLVNFKVLENPEVVGAGTVRRGAAICPVCGFVTPVARVRIQAQAKGELPPRMVAVVRTFPGQQGRHYRIATEQDVISADAAASELRRREAEHEGPLSLVPDEPVPLMSGVFNAPIYGLTDWSKYFLPRQALALSAFSAAVRDVRSELEHEDPNFARSVATCLALAIDRLADRTCTLATWRPQADQEKIEHAFVRQALPMTWDFAEGNPLSGGTASWADAFEPIARVIDRESRWPKPGQSSKEDARSLPLPDDSTSCVVTDPPYYNAVPYADLSDFFYVWLRRSIGDDYPHLFGTPTVPKDGEICEMAGWDPDRYPNKDRAFFEGEMRKALNEIERMLTDDGIAVVVFAHATTAGWEAMLEALLAARLQVTGSWPLETEMRTRLRARDSAALASSVHIVCRPRAEAVGRGSWRDVRPEIHQRIAAWLPRLSQEGIEGADAIFACLGPALEAYSRYDRVETAGGDPVPLSPPVDDPDAPALLPAVWAAVAHTALSMVFEGAEAEGFEEDARLTALWLWTLKAGQNGQAPGDDEGGEEETEGRARTVAGLSLDYDTARKLAQALGAHLEALDHPGGIVDIRGSTARLRPVAERRGALMGIDGTPQTRESTLFESGPSLVAGPVMPGATTLDRLHQAMLLFADGRADALRRLIAEPGYGADERFMRLARSLSGLYPSSSPEKRWVDGILATRR